MNILVCEDNQLTLRLIEQALTRAGFAVLTARDGRAGIKILDEEEVDLLITDINMPFSLGLELIPYVRKTYSATIPIIIVTEINSQETKNHALQLGASGYLTKPLDLSELVGRVNQLLIHA